MICDQRWLAKSLQPHSRDILIGTSNDTTTEAQEDSVDCPRKSFVKIESNMSNESSNAADDAAAAGNIEAEPVQEPPAKKKRGASQQITKDDYEENEGDSENDDKLKQGFQRASAEVIAKRKIYKAKRTLAEPKTAEAPESVANGTQPATFSSSEKKETENGSNNPFSSTTLTPSTKKETENGSNNPFSSTTLTPSTKKVTEAETGPPKVFGFGSAAGFGAATSGSSTGNSSSGFGGFGGFSTAGKAVGFGSPSSSAKGSNSGFKFGSSSSSPTKSLFGNTGSSNFKFSLSKMSDSSNSSTTPKESENKESTILPDNVELKTGEEDEEAVFSGRCKSFQWVTSDVADANNGSDDRTSTKNSNTNPSVQSSKQFQSTISSSKSNDASHTSSNDENKQKTAKSDSDAALEDRTETSTSKPSHRWQELGIGPVKILRSKSKPDRLRLVQRRESSKNGPATKVILNVPLWNESNCDRDGQAQQFLKLKTMNKGKVCQYNLRFKEVAEAGNFHHHLTDQIKKARRCFGKPA